MKALATYITSYAESTTMLAGRLTFGSLSPQLEKENEHCQASGHITIIRPAPRRSFMMCQPSPKALILPRLLTF